MSAEAKPLEYYGATFNIQPMSQLAIELTLFRDRGGLGRYVHFRNAAAILWPRLIWHRWLEAQIRSLCEYNRVHWAGCGGSGKTYAEGLFALVWWLCQPMSSSVVLTSTTGKMIKKRLWPVIQSLVKSCPGFPGNLLNSETALQAEKGDNKNGIFAMAIRQGSVSDALGNLQGYHNKRVMVIIDEAPETPEAAYEACANLEIGTTEFMFLDVGNPVSYFDQHGRSCEPVDGWDSITIDDEEWETKDGGICLHFDGEKSPAIEDTKLANIGIYNKRNLERDQKRGEDSPGYWKYSRGFWAPDGVCRTVLSETMVLRNRARDSMMFVSESFVAAGLDPARGGDRCILRFARIGDLPNGRMGIDFSPFAASPGGIILPSVIPIKLDAGSKTPIDYQVLEQVVKECGLRHCSPNHFGLDSTAISSGLADILHREWSSNIVRVEFGGNASEKPVSQEDRRPSMEVYKNRVAELWFAARNFLEGCQLGGLDNDTIIEFCARLFKETGKPVKIELETKDEMKGRFGRSPDLADAAAVLLEVVRQAGIQAGSAIQGQGRDNEAWEKAAREHDEIWDNGYREEAA